MKNTILLAAAFMLLILPAKSAAPANYGGIWKLNREKSQGLMGMLPGAEFYLAVSQDEKRIHVEQKIRIRGREQPSQELIWNLDGGESTAEVSRPMAGTMHLKARWNEGARSLELLSVIKGDDLGKTVNLSTHEVWELLNNGKSLRITRTRTGLEKKQTSTLVYERTE